MSALGEMMLVMLDRLMPKVNGALISAKRDPFAYMQFFQNRSASSFAAFGNVDLAEKDVLDLGCGLGANLVHLCALGARQVTAVDVDARQIQITRSMIATHYPQLAPRIRFVGADAARLPFDDTCFDVMVAADAFEHIEGLGSALEECARVLRPGGRLYAYFPPFYAPWGAHMVNWIRLPWCQVFFSEPTLLNAARRIEKEGRSVNSLLPPETRLDLLEGDVIPFVSHLTLARFRRIVNRMPAWRIVNRRFLAPGWRTGHWASRLLQPLTLLPVLQEMFVARAVFVLQKTQADGASAGDL
jgi:SAM-dependent methyltransferase